MRNFLIVIVASMFCALSLAQGPEGPTGSTVATCWNGTVTVDDEGEETGPLNMVPCNLAGGYSCASKIEIQSGTHKVDRECKQTLACQNNAAGNVPKCYGGENTVRLCHFCCQTMNCNNFNEIPEQEEPSEEEP